MNGMRFINAAATCLLLHVASSFADTIVATVPGLGTSPGPGIVDPIRNRVYFGDNGVKMLDGATNTLTDLGVPGRVLAYDAMFDRLVVDDNTTSNTQVRLVDPDTLATTSVIPVPAGTHVIAGSVWNYTLYVYTVQSGQGTLTAADMETGAVSSVTVPGAARANMAVNEATHEIYLAGGPPHVMSAFGVMTTLGAQYGESVAVNPVTNHAYMTGIDAVEQFRLLDIEGSSKAVTSIPVGITGSYRLAVNPITNRIYVQGDSAVVVYDGATRAIDATVPLDGKSAVQLAVNTATNKIYLQSFPPANDASPDSLTLLDGATNATTLIAQLPGRAGGLTLNPVTNRVYAWYSCQYLTCSAEMTAVDGNGTAQPVAPTTAIATYPGDTANTTTPELTFTPSAGLAGMPVQAVYFQFDGIAGRWQRATANGDGSFSATPSALTSGSHTLYAFAVDWGVQPANPNDNMGGAPVRVGSMASYTFTVADACASGSCADVALSRTDPAAAFRGKDAIYRLSAMNNGPATMDNTLVTTMVPDSAALIWASPGCTARPLNVAPGTDGSPGGMFTEVDCPAGSLAPGATAQATVVVRPLASGTLTMTSYLSGGSMPDPQSGNNRISRGINVTNPPAANIVPRYRLYSPVSLEHHFTMDANEYAVLGASGAWVQEGQVGNVLDNPGFFNGVQAVPYYRLYNIFTRWHHWTTDPNEYYTLATYPGWNAEDVAGWILPLSTTGTTQLYRLTYPFIGGLHHWTIDANEYNTLISTYGWVGEGGSGFVIQ